MILAKILAEAGDVVNSTSPAIWIIGGFQALANVGFCIRLEHRLTKVEQGIKWLTELGTKTPCDTCQHRPTKYRPHPGLKLPKIDEEEETST